MLTVTRSHTYPWLISSILSLSVVALIFLYICLIQLNYFSMWFIFAIIYKLHIKYVCAMNVPQIKNATNLYIKLAHAKRSQSVWITARMLNNRLIYDNHIQFLFDFSITVQRKPQSKLLTWKSNVIFYCDVCYYFVAILINSFEEKGNEFAEKVTVVHLTSSRHCEIKWNNLVIILDLCLNIIYN